MFTSRFHRFCESRRIPVRILCEDRDGTPIPCVTLGEGERVMLLTASGNVKAVFDLHSPWHQGGRNDKVFLVHKEACGTGKMEHFCRIFMEEVTPESMKYHSADDVVKNEGWNDPAVMNRSCAAYSLTQPGVEFASTLETTYFGEPDNMISQARMLETGRCFARSIKRYFSE